MSKRIVITHEKFSDDLDISDYTETVWDGDYEVQLHNIGALIVVEYIPDLKAADGTKKVELVAIYNVNEWVKAEVK